MPQIVACKKCTKKFKAPDELAGRQVLCPGCKTLLVIPAVGQQAPPATKLPARPSPAKSAAAPTPCIIQCSHCAKRFKGTPQLNGRKVKCPACKADFTVRIAVPTAPAAAAPIPSKSKPTSAPVPLRPASPTAPGAIRPGAPITSLSKPPLASAKPMPATKPSGPQTKTQSSRPQFLYFVFMLAFVPLVMQTLGGESDYEERVVRTLSAHPELEEKMKAIESEADLFALIPEGRFEGAHLSFQTRIHWLYAAVAAFLFFGASWFRSSAGVRPYGIGGSSCPSPARLGSSY